MRDATIQLLRDLELTTFFGNPGSTELPLFRDFPEDFRYVLALQESIAVSMADGYAQARHGAAIVNLHSTAGTGHALGSIFTAFRNQTPLIITAGQQARSILPFEPFLYAERPTEFPRPFVKWACEPSRAQDVPRAIARAYFEAMTPPRGPTFVSIPVDDWDQDAEVVAPRTIATRNPGDPVAVSLVAADLAAAQRPVLVLGAGVARDGAWQALIGLAERTGAAVYGAPMVSRNIFPETHSQFRGLLPASREEILSILEEYDVIASFGGPMNLYHVEGRGPHVPPAARIWLVGDNPGHLACAPAGNAVVADTRLFAESLLAQISPPPRPPLPARAKPVSPDPKILDASFAMHELTRLMPRDSIVVEEAPSCRHAVQMHFRPDRPDSYYFTASGGLGFALPAAVGVALAHPERRVVAILGDGSAMYAIQGLHAAGQLGVQVTFVILNNRRYEALRGFGRLFGISPVQGTDLDGLDFCALSHGHGVPSIHVAEPAELEQALMAGLSGPGAFLVDIDISNAEEQCK